MPSNHHHRDHYDFPKSIPSLLFNHRKGITLYVLVRLLEFIGNSLMYSAMSDDDSAASLSATQSIHDTVSVITGAFIFGVMFEISGKKKQLEHNNYSAIQNHNSATRTESNGISHENPNTPSNTQTEPAPSLITSMVSGLLLAGMLTAISYPGYHYAKNILALTISDEKIVAQAGDWSNQLYKKGVPALFHINWVTSFILTAYDYDYSLMLTYTARLILIAVCSYIWVKPTDDVELRFHRFSLLFLASYLISNFAAIASILTYRDKNNKSLITTHLRWRDLLTKKFWLGTSYIKNSLLPTLFLQMRLGLGPFFGIAPALLTEYFNISVLAPMISTEALEAMTGLITCKVVLLLAGNAILTQVGRKTMQATALINKNTTDAELEALRKYIHLLEKSYLLFNLIMGLIGTLVTVCLYNVIQNGFAPSNEYLGSSMVLLILQLGTTAQIVNDCSEGLLNAFNKIWFKAVTTPLAFFCGSAAAYGFIKAGGEVNGLFGGMGLLMLLNSTLLILYTHNLLPAGKGADIDKTLRERRDKAKTETSTEEEDTLPSVASLHRDHDDSVSERSQLGSRPTSPNLNQQRIFNNAPCTMRETTFGAAQPTHSTVTMTAV